MDESAAAAVVSVALRLKYLPEEIDEKVSEQQAFTHEQLAVLHKDGPRSEIEYRLAWARTYLKGIGALTNAARGIWETTPLGRELDEHEIDPRWRD